MAFRPVVNSYKSVTVPLFDQRDQNMNFSGAEQRVQTSDVHAALVLTIADAIDAPRNKEQHSLSLEESVTPITIHPFSKGHFRTSAHTNKERSF